MVVDTDGMLISARDKEKVGTNVDFIPKMKEKSGPSVWTGGCIFTRRSPTGGSMW